VRLAADGEVVESLSLDDGRERAVAADGIMRGAGEPAAAIGEY
jgi:hypothetical protein